jgi:hypothetical protein
MGTFVERKFIGAAEIKMRVAGASAGFIDVGDVQEAVVTQEESEISAPNMRGGGGKAFSKKRLDAVGLRFKYIDLTAARMAQVMRANVTDVAAGSASSEAHTAYHGGFIPLDYVDPSSIVVTGSGGTPTYVVDTDYTLGYNGIEILSTGSISDASAIEISYSYSDQKVIEAFVNSSENYEVYIDGINDAKDGEYYTIRAHKWNPGYPSEWAILTEALGEFDVAGEVLPDNTKTGTLSKFLQIKQTEGQ